MLGYCPTLRGNNVQHIQHIVSLWEQYVVWGSDHLDPKKIMKAPSSISWVYAYLFATKRALYRTVGTVLYLIYSLTTNRFTLLGRVNQIPCVIGIKFPHFLLHPNMPICVFHCFYVALWLTQLRHFRHVRIVMCYVFIISVSLYVILLAGWST